MSYRCCLRHLTNEELHERQISCGMALDKAHTSADPRVRRQKGNIRAKYQRILAEIEKRSIPAIREPDGE